MKGTFKNIEKINGEFVIRANVESGDFTASICEAIDILLLHSFLACNNTNITKEDVITDIILSEGTIKVLAVEPDGKECFETIYGDDEFFYDEVLCLDETIFDIF